MAKLTEINITEIIDGESRSFRATVSVSKEGLFSTTLSKETLDALSEYMVDTETNRLGNKGYFAAKTLDELKRDLHRFLKECYSKTLVEDRLVVKYFIHTQCTYVRDSDGELVPNGVWSKDRKPGDQFCNGWKEGNYKSTSQDRFSPTLSVWAKVYHKQRYAYLSGKEVIKYEQYIPNDREKRPKDWLNSQVNTTPFPDYGYNEQALATLPEMEATEENCKFFISIIKLIWNANEMLGAFMNPDVVREFIESNRPLQIGEKTP